MYGFCEKLRLKGMAEEDIYFARRDRELIAAMKLQAEADECQSASVNEKSKVDVHAEDVKDAATGWQFERRSGDRSEYSVPE